VKLLSSLRGNPWAFRWPILAASFLALSIPTRSVEAQEELTLPELEGLYRGAMAGYEEAFEVLEVLESQFDRASQDLAGAIAAGDEETMNEAYAETQRIGPQRRQAQRRVEEKAEELRRVRLRLLDATARYLEDLLAEAATEPDSAAQRTLATFIADTRNRISELRSLEDPQVTLEPEPEINPEPRDGPDEYRAKANILEVRLGQYQEQYVFNQEQLDGLRRDQRLLRRSGDFLADFARFDDPTLPVGLPGSRSVPNPGQISPPPGADTTRAEGRPLTLEERIQALELLQEEIARRIDNIRIRAATLRRLAGGEWA
jgi:hypothetical protein